MVVPHRNPGEVLVTGHKIEIGAVRSMSLPVIVQRVDLLVRQSDAAKAVTPTVISFCVLVDVIPQVNYVVDAVLPHGVAVGVEEAECCVLACQQWYEEFKVSRQHPGYVESPGHVLQGSVPGMLTVIGARVDSEANVSYMVAWSRRGLRAAQRTGVVGFTDSEGIVILCVWPEVDSFNLVGRQPSMHFGALRISRQSIWLKSSIHHPSGIEHSRVRLCGEPLLEGTDLDRVIDIRTRVCRPRVHHIAERLIRRH